jgi:chromate transport protein ChrA
VESAGAIIATIFVFLPSFIFVLVGALDISKWCATIVRYKRFSPVRAQAVVGVIVVVTLDLIPSALVDLPTIAMALTRFFRHRCVEG